MRPKVVPNTNRSLAIALSELGFRLNGTRPNDFRTSEMTFGKTAGSCEVVFPEGTRVFCQVSASVGEPSESRPGEGILTVSAWISPSATGETGGGGSGAKKPAIIARTVEKLFKDNRVVDLESLCIKFGEKVWVLRIDVHILDTNGCLAEAAALAVLGGLLTFRMPQASVETNTGKLTVLTLDEAVPVRLHLHHHPILTSFVLTPTNKILAEPDQQEEDIFPGKVLIGINESKEVCYLHCTTPINYDILSEATTLAQAKCLERVKWIKELVRRDDEVRAVPLYLQENHSRKEGNVIDITSILEQHLIKDPVKESGAKVCPISLADEIRILQLESELSL